jgi:hypothetical protein
MYGDPTTTPGGKAIPFHSSIRVKLGAGQQIKDGEDVVGIHVSAKTVKNKVSPPFRSINFQIHFGKGIREHEEVFDVLRKHGEDNVLEHYIAEVAGSGQWKTFRVTDVRTGEVFIEKKFRKAGFDELMCDKEYGPYIDALLEKAMVKVMSDPESVDINVDSYEEIKSLAAELDETLFEE